MSIHKSQPDDCLISISNMRVYNIARMFHREPLDCSNKNPLQPSFATVPERGSIPRCTILAWPNLFP